MGKKKDIIDHLNNKYGSITEMCEHYGITTRLYYDRINRGYNLGQALGQEKKPRKFSHTKEELMEKLELTEEEAEISIELKLGIPDMRRLHNGRLFVDHKNQIFKSFLEMCNCYKVSTQTVKKRMKEGWDLGQALEGTPPK